MSGPPSPARPSLPWRIASMAVMGSVGLLSRAFIYGLNDIEVRGLDRLLGVLDRRKAQGRERGLLTVCNHVAVLDDPLMWGILPLRYCFDVTNLRWGLGAHDICFKNKATSTFFSLGQVLPTHRLWHSPHGGLFQPTMAQAVKLLSGPSYSSSLSPPPWVPSTAPIASPVIPMSSLSSSPLPPVEPESLSFSTNGADDFLAPASYATNRYAWVHVFPEACCHQSSDSGLRYFKWGISRLILESDPAPEFIPMFIHGTQNIMPEDRGWPKWAPRIRTKVKVVIGQPTDVDQLFGTHRAAWRNLVEKGDPELLKHSAEAVELRVAVARKVRHEVEKLRESMGFPAEEDESAALAETWAKEPHTKTFKSPVDGSLVNRH
ncbi:Lyso-phosphatidylcholine acyltransferase [Neonectria magnoliae]|uniref:Tafazzin family protein n=1 Tax=Neonectria magnoliae TaxID=2732573 RepID=A0ABR1HDE2_9HYPO